MEEASAALLDSAARYIDGDSGDEAEDAYFALEERALTGDLHDGLRILERLASLVHEHSLDAFGAGFLENFLSARGSENVEAIADAIEGSRRLITALRGVRSVALDGELLMRLAPLEPTS